MPLDSLRVTESQWLLPGDRGAVYALTDSEHAWSGSKSPLLLVHGITPHPQDLRDLIRRLSGLDGYQLYFFAYDSLHRRTSQNGDELASELRAWFKGRRVTIVAHSMGGIVARRALNDLYPESTEFRSLVLHAADTPWHGFAGPADPGPRPDLLVRLSLPFLPAGLLDMRAGSWMFRSPVDGLNTFPVADNVSIHLAFSQSGSTASDYRKGKLRSLAWETWRWFGGQAGPPTGSFELQNFWAAIQHSSAYPAFLSRLGELQAAGQLTAASTLYAYAEFFPEYPGDHTGMLAEHPGQLSYLDALTAELENSAVPARTRRRSLDPGDVPR